MAPFCCSRPIGGALTAAMVHSQQYRVLGSRQLHHRHPHSGYVTRLKGGSSGVPGVKRIPYRVQSLFGGGNKDNDNGERNDKNPFSNFSELLKTAQDAQVRASVEAQKVQEELSKVEFDGYDEEETVRVVVTGNQEPKSVELTESVMKLQLEDVQQRIVDAMKDAHTKSVTGMKGRMRQLYSDLGFPMPPQQ